MDSSCFGSRDRNGFMLIVNIDGFCEGKRATGIHHNVLRSNREYTGDNVL
jgi:hypothetical protein